MDVLIDFAKKHNDIVRIIVGVSKDGVYDFLIHDKFGKKIDIDLNEVVRDE